MAFIRVYDTLARCALLQGHGQSSISDRATFVWQEMIISTCTTRAPKYTVAPVEKYRTSTHPPTLSLLYTAIHVRIICQHSIRRYTYANRIYQWATHQLHRSGAR